MTKNTHLEFKCTNLDCGEEVTEEELIDEYDLWQGEDMEELTEDEQANIIRQHADCPHCGSTLTELTP